MKITCGDHTHLLAGYEALLLDGQRLEIAADMLAAMIEVACRHGLLKVTQGNPEPLSPDC
jgi:hypothetical protein